MRLAKGGKEIQPIGLDTEQQIAGLMACPILSASLVSNLEHCQGCTNVHMKDIQTDLPTVSVNGKLSCPKLC